ncbi:secretory carrier-associated membrane protein [Anaeramoeba flamelloides]|uniref:Secretory carrier-associated membrane protein n=1 Tax=Anaeramoeba flamelloides TaxID=1746091 RepID=A0AAV8A4K0_9EUKA|nr:secretory carrier-associated membrane protein [Anaeramoeba flamelloides]
MSTSSNSDTSSSSGEGAINPFDDSSIKKAQKTENDQNNEQFGMTTNNPFETEGTGGFQEPKFIKERNLNGEKSYDERLREVQRLEAELDIREREIKNREMNLGEDYDRTPNWPRCKPFLFHDIPQDIPVQAHGFMRMAYFNWMFGTACLIWNAFCLISKLFVKEVDGKGNDLVISILFVVFGVPFAWIFWYRLLYNAARKKKSSKFILFFSTFSVWMLYSVFICIGIKGTGAAGLINLIDIYDQNKVVGVFCIINFCIWICCVLLYVWVIVRVNKYYKSSGLTTEQAKDEARTEVRKQAQEFI